MSWVNDLVSASGLPAGAATLAVAMYAACVAAEKAASLDALNDIGRILKDQGWERTVRPSAVIQRVFNLTFGERHFSWKCLRRSAGATLAVMLAGIAVLRLEGYDVTPPDEDNIWEWARFIIFIGILFLFPDYLALAKTRILIGAASRRNAISFILGLLFADIFLSLLISNLSYTAMAELVRGRNLIEAFKEMTVEIYSRALEARNGEHFPMYIVSLISTLFTSVWIALVLVSGAALKLLAPIHRFTGWFFNVDKHPIRAIGFVSGALLMLGSGIWTVVRSII